MPQYSLLSREEKENELEILKKQYKTICNMNLSLDMSRGRPCRDQAAFAMDMLTCLTPEDMILADGSDVRNYGIPAGILSARKLMGGILGLDPMEVYICGSSSLNIMFDLVSHAYLHGVYGSSEPWSASKQPKFLCPVPGYDRHFAITEYFGIYMINIPLYEDGPDMDMVESYVNSDPDVKGMWCIPKYSNPTGITYSDEVVRRLAALKPAADNFRIFWDNSYVVHDLYENDKDELANIMDLCKEYGSEDMVYEFTSTSKMTFAGSGLAALGASRHNIEYISKQFAVESIGWNKLNMLMHVKFLKDNETIAALMKKHAAVLRPKFKAVEEILEAEVSDIAKWKNPKGGYFISFNVMDGCATRVYSLCKDAGVKLTPVGATYPYGHDPHDSNIRIAPTSPDLDDLTQATALLCLCTKIATLEKLLAEGDPVEEI